MTINRFLAVYVTTNRKARVYQAAPMSLHELIDRLRVSQTIPHTIEAYKALPKAQQDDLKDIGGFVLGELEGGRRKSGAVLSRCAAVLDADNLPAGGTDELIRRVAALGLCCCVYSTAKHCPQAPRLRVVFPFGADIPAEQYPPVARLLCRCIQQEMTWFDPTTAQAERMMYWPAHCQDVAPVWYEQDGSGLLDVAALLAQQLPTWQDPTTWPAFPNEQRDMDKALKKAKQQDPESKEGVVGAFCRAYNVPAAMDKYLPGIYEETATADRYTFTGGSTWGGAVLYGGGKWLFSHHATDPAGGKLVNTFDLVRLHKFADLDDEAPEGARGNRLPSYAAMVQMAREDEAVRDELARERVSAVEDFGLLFAGEGPIDVSWMRGLTMSGTGSIERTSANILHVLENDPHLKGRIFQDTFADKVFGIAPLPWGDHLSKEGLFEWVDADDDGLVIYLEKLLGFRAPSVVQSALNDHLARHSVNPVTDYINGLTWDGVPRLDTFFVDYLGAADTPYTRAVTRKSFTAAVARAKVPGIKFDNMLILSGPQGGYKSSCLAIMGGSLFTDSLMTFNGKDAAEVLQGKWIVEIAELQAFSNTDVNKIKQFISSQNDHYRAAYGHRAVDHPRCCVFFGTTNAKTFLRDPTGGRRFWPVYVGLQPSVKKVWESLPEERDQLWAEAKIRWQLGEPLFLSGELWEYAQSVQESARETDAREGLILDFLSKPVPKDWAEWSIDKRRSFWSGVVIGEPELAPRTRVCAMEVWCELFGKDKADAQQREARTINAILDGVEGWERIGYPDKFGPYGNQKGFKTVATV